MIALPSALLLRAIIGGVLAGALCSLVGVFAVRLRMSSIGFCMSHSAFAGAALGTLLALDPLLMAMSAALATAALLGPVSDKARLPANVIAGIMFPMTMALAFVFLMLLPGPVVGLAALSLLWGSVLTVSPTDVILLAVLMALATSFTVLFWKELNAVLFHPRMAEADGINSRAYMNAIIFMLGAVVALSLKLVGGLLVYALVMNSASTALQLSYDMRKVFLISPLVGVMAFLGGFGLSMWLDLPVGSSIVLVSSLIFASSVALSPKRKRGEGGGRER
ncbi:metal ABC transporter permease [Candidatus Bathyarchaeota archaeon]|nr:MAG: metal ABC transporter permease [Candidatus Bathyarchaeota archaeon]